VWLPLEFSAGASPACLTIARALENLDGSPGVSGDLCN